MTPKKQKHAISPMRSEDYPEWYQQVIKAADLAENAPVRGCMVIKPWGYAIWENIRQLLDAQIKATGHENAYFPLFIPLSFFEKEAKHVEGFAKECAVVTHHRLEEKNGRLIPTGELEEPLIVRPTSETIIGDAFSRWVESYRDLPLLINQWANVVRWEMRPRVFLRTTEFLWQEGHTAHATHAEAVEETLKMLEVYRRILEEELAIPVIVGEKSPGERFPGAEHTYTLEAMMQDGKALQSCTSHDLGQNFAKASNIKFNTADEQTQYAYTTSWGMTTRVIGSLIMCHGDDDGLRLPPRISPKHVVIIPIIPKPELEQAILSYAEKLAQELRSKNYANQAVVVHIDKRDRRGGEKNWEWIKKGVPLRIEIGPRDLEAGTITLGRRDDPTHAKIVCSTADFVKQISEMLGEIQNNYYRQAKAYLDAHTHKNLENFAQLKAFFTSSNENGQQGFVLAKWCGDPETESLLQDLKVTIRCLPLQQSHTNGQCILTGRAAVLDAIFAKSY